MIPLTEAQKSIRNIVIREDSSPFQLRDLTPGATYEIQLYTVYENKESAAYISTNFTTQPNTPGRFIVWFRNETTLLVLWQPPYPAGVYSDYKVGGTFNCISFQATEMCLLKWARSIDLLLCCSCSFSENMPCLSATVYVC